MTATLHEISEVGASCVDGDQWKIAGMQLSPTTFTPPPAAGR